MRLWALPAPLHEAVRFHHDPALADDPRPAAVTYAAVRSEIHQAFAVHAELAPQIPLDLVTRERLADRLQLAL